MLPESPAGLRTIGCCDDLMMYLLWVSNTSGMVTPSEPLGFQGRDVLGVTLCTVHWGLHSVQWSQSPLAADT